MTTKEEFFAEFGTIEKKIRASHDTSYGANVMPYLRLYRSLEKPDSRRAFQDALEELLQSSDNNTRKTAVTICLGFFAFCDVK